ncbi:MAG: plasmid mobilization relaxosome protein MobC [Flavobacterium sp.]|nr:MAG: plasmid mobilization relaxosome protein MobC [Flavobacterium sp.]
MKDVKKEVRNKWLHIRLNGTEYSVINSYWQKTTTKELSDYARRVLLKKPVTVNHRNQSADEILAELIRLKNELHAIGNNFNQAVHKLHTLDTIPQIKIWLLANEKLKNSFLKKTEEIKIRMTQIYEQWSQK